MESASNNYIYLLFNPNLYPILFFNPRNNAEQVQMHDNRHTRSPMIITTALYGTRMAHIFIRVCTLIYNGVSPSAFTRHLGQQYLPQTAEVIPHLLAPPPRCSRHQEEAQMHGTDCSGRVACGWDKRIDQHQPQSTGSARTGMQNRRDPRPVAGPWPGSSVQAIHVAVFSARQLHSSAMSRWMYE